VSPKKIFQGKIPRRKLSPLIKTSQKSFPKGEFGLWCPWKIAPISFKKEKIKKRNGFG